MLLLIGGKNESGFTSRSHSPHKKKYSPLNFIAMTKEKNTKQVNTKKEPTKTLKEKRAEKQAKRADKSKG